jgi:hypothetical protein
VEVGAEIEAAVGSPSVGGAYLDPVEACSQVDQDWVARNSGAVVDACVVADLRYRT